MGLLPVAQRPCTGLPNEEAEPMGRKEMKAQVEKWLTQIPEKERDVPWFVLETEEGPKGATPGEAIDDLDRPQTLMATPLARRWGKGMAAMAEQLSVDGYDLVLEQVKARNKIAKDQGHSGFFGTLDGVYFSLDAMVEHMEQGTEYGVKFRRMFTRLYDELIRKLV